jgi:putative MATE family efflux protein
VSSDILKSGVDENKVTSGPIPRTIISLALPVVMGMFMEFALSTTDYYWVGKLGANAQDSITSSMVVIWTMFALISIISVGVTALVSRNVGSGDFEKVRYFIKQGLAFAVILGLACTVGGYFVAPVLLKFMHTSDATFAWALPYLRVFFLTTLLFWWSETVYAVFRASGDTKTPTLVGVLSVVINMVMDPMLIFGIGPFPRLGVVGASVATAIAMFVSMIVITVLLLKGKLLYRVDRLFHLRPKVESMLRIAKIGIPVSGQQLIFVIVYWFLIRIVHAFGDTAGAAMGIGNRMESFSYLTCSGFSVAAATMVGQNLGAKKPDRAARCAWGSAGIAVAITFVITILFVTLPAQIASVFTSDPEVHKIATDYIFILGLSQSAMALEIVLEGSFGGAGDTLPPMAVQVPLSLARVPLAYLLAFNAGWGVNGVWWTLTFTSVAKAAILSYMFGRGKWKLKQV